MQQQNVSAERAGAGFIAYASRLQAILVIAAMFPFLPLCLLNLVLLPGAPLVLRAAGLLILAPIVVWLFVSLQLILLSEPVLEIDGRGILWRRWSDERIPWTAIERWRTRQALGLSYATLWLREPDRYPARTINGLVSRGNRWMGYGHLTLSAGGTDRGMPELIAAMRRHAPSATLQAGS